MCIRDSPTGAALAVAAKYDASVIDMRFVKPLDTELIQEVAATHKYLLTVEDNVRLGGAGSAVNEFLKSSNINIPIMMLGLPDRFQEHATRDELLSEAGIDTAGIEQALNTITSRS